MLEDKKNIASIPSEGRDESIEILQKIPDRVLMGEIADRVQHRPNGELSSIVHEVLHIFSGPIPSPETLNGYENIQEGLAGRIVSMAENEQNHRHNCQNKAINAAILVERRGQLYALFLAFVCIAGAIHLISMGEGKYGIALLGSTLIGLAYVFITGRKKDKKKKKKQKGGSKEQSENAHPLEL